MKRALGAACWILVGVAAIPSLDLAIGIGSTAGTGPDRALYAASTAALLLPVVVVSVVGPVESRLLALQALALLTITLALTGVAEGLLSGLSWCHLALPCIFILLPAVGLTILLWVATGGISLYTFVRSMERPGYVLPGPSVMRILARAPRSVGS